MLLKVGSAAGGCVNLVWSIFSYHWLALANLPDKTSYRIREAGRMDNYRYRLPFDSLGLRETPGLPFAPFDPPPTYPHIHPRCGILQ